MVVVSGGESFNSKNGVFAHSHTDGLLSILHPRCCYGNATYKSQLSLTNFSGNRKKLRGITCPTKYRCSASKAMEIQHLLTEPQTWSEGWVTNSLPKMLRVQSAPIHGCKRSTVGMPLASIGALVAASGAITTSTTSSSPHSAVVSTLTQLAVTAVAIASGACLSTQVESLWPRNEEGPEELLLEGVDVTGYSIFQETEVLKAISFAKEAHSGQMRKTGDPYLTHCIHTAKILAALVPQKGKRAINTVVAGLLHDVIDDTSQDIQNIRYLFGDDVAKLVAGVSKLSHINQLLRRHRRTSAERTVSKNGSLSLGEINSLRVMLLGMVNDPRVVLIKLADRLHNMRTIHALPPSKAHAVAQETLAVWCSLASRLGMWAVKAELEDLCFAVLQTQTFRKLRHELAAMWSPDKDWRYSKRITKRAKRKALLYGEDLNEHLLQRRVDFMDEEEPTMKELLESVMPFDVLSDRQKRRRMLGMLTKSGSCGRKKTRVMRDAEVALASLAACEEALERELLISTSYVPGMEFTLSGRLKSLYSTYCKMIRKGVGVDQIYDARALRVVVGDGHGELLVPAVEGCYNLLSVVHSLWTPIGGEFDDYILNPKPSGYQSLHTAVQGLDGAPLEVQIRTQGMHEYAEYGHAAHWLYKEADSFVKPPNMTSDTLSPVRVPDGCPRNEIEDSSKEVSTATNELTVLGKVKVPLGRSIQLGHPALRIEDGRLLAAVVMSIDADGRELLVAVSFALHAREVAAGRSGNQRRRWATYAKLYKKVSDQWWFAPGHGDWNTWLEKYTLCSDGIYHKQDQFQRLLPTFIQLLDLDGQELEEYQEIMDVVFQGKELDTLECTEQADKSTNTVITSGTSTDARLNNKVRLLRSMLQWEKQLRSEASTEGVLNILHPDHPNTAVLAEVLVIRWPDGEIMRMPSGSTAADAARRMGMDGKFIFVNSQVALPHMQLRDGDIIEVRV